MTDKLTHSQIEDDLFARRRVYIAAHRVKTFKELSEEYARRRVTAEEGLASLLCPGTYQIDDYAIHVSPTGSVEVEDSDA